MSELSVAGVARATSSPVRRGAWWLLWLLLAAISLHFLYTVLGKYGQLDPEHYTMYWSRRAWLWLHIAGGTLGIVLGPVQFLSRWPRPFARLHRWSGRLYFAGMLLASAAAVGLIATSPAPMAITLAFAATAVAWLVCALVAMLGLRAGNIPRHRRWMTRAYLVTLAPVTFRLLLPAWIALGNAPGPGVIAVLLWVSWVLPLSLHAACVHWSRRASVMPTR